MRPRPSQIHRVVHDRSTIRWWCRPTLNEGGSHALQVCQHHHHPVVRVGNFVGLSETQGTRKGTRCSRLLRPIRLKPSRSHSAHSALYVTVKVATNAARTLTHAATNLCPNPARPLLSPPPPSPSRTPSSPISRRATGVCGSCVWLSVWRQLTYVGAPKEMGARFPPSQRRTGEGVGTGARSMDYPHSGSQKKHQPRMRGCTPSL